MKPIEILPLRCLEAAARLGSLTAAARSLGLSQPAVSVQIASLERALGARLLVRGARGVRPTPAGETALVRARRILDEVRGLEGSIGEGPLSGSLRIGSTDVVMLHRLPPLLRRFRRDHPAVDLRIVIEGSASLATALRAREIELALVTLPLPGAPGPVQPLYQDRLVLVASPGDPLASRKRLTLDAVARAPLLEHKAGSVTRSIVESFFSAHGLVPRVAMEISSPEVLRRLARSGLGIAVLPEASVREEARRGLLKILAVQGWNLTRTSGLLLPPAGPPSRSGRAFVDLLLGSFRGRTGRSGLPAEGSAGGTEKPARLPRRPETT